MGETEHRGFGTLLRQAREDAGWTLAELAECTRVQAHYIEALEGEDWDDLPRGVIGRGFVRVLARELRADPEQLLAAYRDARGEADGSPVHTLPQSDWKVDLRSGRRPPVPVLVAAFLLGSGVAIWIWSPWDVAPPELLAPPPPAAAPVAQPPLVPPADVAPEAPPPLVAPAPPEPPAPAPVPSVPPAPLRLEVRAVEKVWVRVIVDGGDAQDRLMAPGERLEFEGREGFRVKLGNAANARLYWNDAALRVPGQPGQVVTLEFPEALERLRP